MEVVALALAVAACLGLAAACLWLRRELRRLQAALAQQAEEGAARERRLKELSKRIESYQQVNVRMGEALQDLGKQLAPLPDRVARLEQRDPTTLSFSQAARLVGLGASAEDLTQRAVAGRGRAGGAPARSQGQVTATDPALALFRRAGGSPLLPVSPLP